MKIRLRKLVALALAIGAGVFVCFFMILSGIILGLFDFFSSQVIQFIIELS